MKVVKMGSWAFGRWDHLFRGVNDWMLLIARVAIAAIYVPSGFTKLMHLGVFAQNLAAHGVSGGTALAVLGACVEFFGAMFILLGFRMRLAALLMAAFTLVAALISHRFWDAADAARSTQYVQFMKNIAITGGFLGLFVASPGRYSMDGQFELRRLWTAGRRRYQS